MNLGSKISVSFSRLKFLFLVEFRRSVISVSSCHLTAAGLHLKASIRKRTGGAKHPIHTCIYIYIHTCKFTLVSFVIKCNFCYTIHFQLTFSLYTFCICLYLWIFVYKLQKVYRLCTHVCALYNISLSLSLFFFPDLSIYLSIYLSMYAYTLSRHRCRGCILEFLTTSTLPESQPWAVLNLQEPKFQGELFPIYMIHYDVPKK